MINSISKDVSPVGGSCEIDNTSFNQGHTFTSPNLTTDAVSIGVPSFLQDHQFVSNNILTGLPSIQQTLLSQKHILLSNNISSGNVVISSPQLNIALPRVIAFDQDSRNTVSITTNNSASLINDGANKISTLTHNFANLPNDGTNKLIIP